MSCWLLQSFFFEVGPHRLCNTHYSTDLVVAVPTKDIQQCASTDREEEDAKLINMDLNNTGFSIVQKSVLQMFSGGGYTLGNFCEPSWIHSVF